MTRLFLIRHGNTLDEETKKVYKGRIDIPLSQTGVLRMEKAATFLAAFPMDRIFTSTLSRSVESGKLVAKQQNLEIEVEPAFDEVGFGVWEGLTFDEIRTGYPKEHARWIEDPGTYPPPEGESFDTAQERSMNKLGKILEECRGQTVAVVAHAGILRIMIFSLLNMKLSRLFRIGQDYGAINIIDFWDDDNLSMNLLNFTYY
jgi:broad specificity phosphatase PhoE